MDAYLLFNFALVLLGSMLIGWSIRGFYERAKSGQSVETEVCEHGTITPTFKFGGKYTSGSLKYFHHLRGKRVRVTINLLD